MEQFDCFELFCVIVEQDLGERVIALAHQKNIQGATTLIGRGTIRNKFLHILGLDSVAKDIVLMGAPSKLGTDALHHIYKEMNMHKKGKGIAFSLPLASVLGSVLCKSTNIKKSEDKKMNYQLIFTIVDRGNADLVMDAAFKAGSTGGTIINARGSGIHETKKIFNIAIEPEKEIIMILAKTDQVETITSTIRDLFHIDDPGKGIIFIMDVNQTYGLYDQ